MKKRKQLDDIKPQLKIENSKKKLNEDIMQFLGWINQHYYLINSASPKKKIYRFLFNTEILYLPDFVDWDKPARSLIKRLLTPPAIQELYKALQGKTTGGERVNNWSSHAQPIKEISISSAKPINYCTMLLFIAREKKLLNLYAFISLHMMHLINWKTTFYRHDQHGHHSSDFLSVFMAPSDLSFVNLLKNFTKKFPFFILWIYQHSKNISEIKSPELINLCKTSLLTVYDETGKNFPEVITVLILDYILENIVQFTKALNACSQKIETAPSAKVKFFPSKARDTDTTVEAKATSLNLQV